MKTKTNIKTEKKRKEKSSDGRSIRVDKHLLQATHAASVANGRYVGIASENRIDVSNVIGKGGAQ